MTYLGYSEEQLKEADGYWTAREIEQQPDSWLRTIQYVSDNERKITGFVEPLLSRSDCRIILTGAGTSAFAGTCLAPYLSQELGRQVEAIPTTDIVSAPQQALHKEIPTLLVSFARSGNSPESVAAAELADSMLDECYQLVISCNEHGQLYKKYEDKKDCLTLLMPEETNDRAFAMTSSFTSMLLTAVSIFAGAEGAKARVARISSAVGNFIRTQNDTIKKIADSNCSRVVYLGSNGMAGLAQEASLKLLELTDGKVLTMHESSLGVRHGPKSILNEDTLVVIFMSADSYTRKYDVDILNELIADDEVKRIVALTSVTDFGKSGSELFTIEETEQFSDLDLLLPFVVYSQIYGFHHAMRLGNRPDNPSASGTVNRVVKGVNIHARTA